MKKHNWTAEEKQALEKSIEKWDGVTNHGKIEMGQKDCACCKIWFDNGCSGCPIRKETGNGNCYETPHVQWSDYWDSARCGAKVAKTTEEKSLARAELDFLKELLASGDSSFPKYCVVEEKQSETKYEKVSFKDGLVAVELMQTKSKDGYYIQVKWDDSHPRPMRLNTEEMQPLIDSLQAFFDQKEKEKSK